MAAKPRTARPDTGRPDRTIDQMALRDLTGDIQRAMRRTACLAHLLEFQPARQPSSAENLLRSGVRVVRGWNLPVLSPSLFGRIITTRSDDKGVEAFTMLADDLWAITGRWWSTREDLPAVRAAPGWMMCCLLMHQLAWRRAHPLLASEVYSGSPESAGIALMRRRTGPGLESSRTPRSISDLVSQPSAWWSVLQPDAMSALRCLVHVIRSACEAGVPQSAELLDPMRPARWFADIKRATLYPSKLRNAWTREVIVGERRQIKKKKRMFYDVMSVAGYWPDEAELLQDALRREIEEKNQRQRRRR